MDYIVQENGLYHFAKWTISVCNIVHFVMPAIRFDIAVEIHWQSIYALHKLMMKYLNAATDAFSLKYARPKQGLGRQ